MNMLFQIIDLYQKVRERYKDYELGRFKIYRTDSLEKPAQKQIWDYGHQAFLEEQDEIDEIKKKKFDFVVGNPPYVRVQRLSNEDKQKYAETYKTAEKNYDIYVLFFERGVKWLKDRGLLSFICSNRFTTVNYGEKLREFLLQNTIIEEFVDFKDTGVFKDVLNYPSIITLRKGMSRDYFTKVCIFKKKDDKISEKELTYLIKRDIRKLRTIEDHFENEYFETFGTTSRTLSSKGFYFIPQYKQRLLEKWTTLITLKDLSATKKESSALFEGSSTGYKDLYVLKSIKKSGFYVMVKCPVDGRKYKIEKELIKNYVEDAGKWLPKHEDMVLIFPYQMIDDGYQIIQENTLKNKYPLCWQYLDEHKDKLRSRKSLKTSVWYAYSAPRSLENYGITKLLIQGFSVYSSVSIDEDGDIFFGPDIYGLPIKEEYKHLTKYFLAVLNSNITNFFIRQVGVIHGSGYYKFEDRFIKRLPIKIPETAKEKQIANQIIKKVDEILELHKKAGILDIGEILKGQETQKLYNLPSVSFSIKDNAKFENMEVKASKIFINSEDYVQIKDKKIRDFVAIYLDSVEEKLSKAKDVKSVIYNIEVPKSNEVMKEIIKKGSFDRADVRDQIKKLEQEINELVYEIYGVTKEERRIIEESLR